MLLPYECIYVSPAPFHPPAKPSHAPDPPELVVSELFDVSRPRVLQERNYPHISSEGCREMGGTTGQAPCPCTDPQK